MLPPTPRRLLAISAALLPAVLIWGTPWQAAADDEPQPAAAKNIEWKPPQVTRQDDPAGERRPAAPRSVLRMGSVKTETTGSDGDPPAKAPSAQAPPAKAPSAQAPPANTSSETPEAPGRIQPHNPQPVAGDARKLITRAHQLSQSAETEEDFTQILELCQQAAAVAKDDELVAYLNRLASWAYDYRGQILSESASQRATAYGKLTEAQELERRALADFDRAVHLDPTRWRAVHNRGVSYALLGKEHYTAALKDFDRTVQLEPNFYKAWFNRAEIRRELGRYERALEDYARAVALKAGDKLAHRGRAHAYYQSGQRARALESFSQVVKLAPDDALAWVDRADLCAELNRWEAAAKDYQQALKIDKELGRAYLGVAWLMATCPDGRIRNPEFSVKAAEKAIELDGVKDHHYLDTLAAAYASAGMYDEAKVAAKQAIENAPVAARAAVKNRLALYEQQRPYHQSARTVRPAGATVP